MSKNLEEIYSTEKGGDATAPGSTVVPARLKILLDLSVLLNLQYGKE